MVELRVRVRVRVKSKTSAAAGCHSSQTPTLPTFSCMRQRWRCGRSTSFSCRRPSSPRGGQKGTHHFLVEQGWQAFWGACEMRSGFVCGTSPRVGSQSSCRGPHHGATEAPPQERVGPPSLHASGIPPHESLCGWRWDNATVLHALLVYSVVGDPKTNAALWGDVLHHLCGLGNALHIVQANCNFLPRRMRHVPYAMLAQLRTRWLVDLDLEYAGSEERCRCGYMRGKEAGPRALMAWWPLPVACAHSRGWKSSLAWGSRVMPACIVCHVPKTCFRLKPR